MKLRHMVGGLIFLSIISTLIFGTYSSLISSYNIVSTHVDPNGKTIAERFNDLHIIQGINSTLKGIYNIKNPTGNVVDTVGALYSIGIGVAELTAGLVTFPFQIAYIITDFYYIPPIITTGLLTLLMTYIAYILISAYLRGDL